MMKISKHIAFYFNAHRIQYVNKIINETNGYRHSTDIFIHTSCNFSFDLLSAYHNGSINLVIHDVTNNELFKIDPYFFNWTTRDLIREQRDDYDVFMYVEDDIVVPSKAIEYWLKYNEQLIEMNYNLGFVRIEVDDNCEEYITDLYGEQLDKIIDINGNKYCVNNKNPYCAFWIYNKSEFNKFVNSEFYDISNISGYGYGPGESVAIGLHALKGTWYKNTVIPIIGNKLIESCRIYHLPNNYVDGSTQFATIKFDNAIHKSAFMTLPELFKAHNFNTDKDNPCHSFRGKTYLDVYEGLFSQMRNQEFTLIEFGVLHGGSLRMWLEYFPKAKVVGVDVNPEAMQYVPDGARFVLASQTNEAAIKLALSSLPPLGVVIDDGSHYVPHMIESFRFLWPMVMDGGIYVMEDAAISYDAVDPDWPGMDHNQETFEPNRRGDLDALLLKLIRTMDELDGDVRAVEFHPMMVAIRKSQLLDETHALGITCVSGEAIPLHCGPADINAQIDATPRPLSPLPVWCKPVVGFKPAKKIIGFWHIGVVGVWRKIIAEQYAKLMESGLYDVSEKIVVGFVGGKNRECELNIPILDDPKFEVFITNDTKDYELPTVARVWKEAQEREESFLCYYFHTKGASLDGTPNEEPGNAWRLYMEYFNLERWEDCVEILKEYETCGVEHRVDYLYDGNFWWARSDYIKKLPNGYEYWEQHKDDRHVAERYLCLARPKSYCFNDFTENLYDFEIPPERYRK